MPDIRLTAAVAVAAASLVALPAAATPGTASAAAFGARTLERGMYGPDVKTAQVLLRRTGGKLTADGAFGPETQRAVRVFERQAGLDGDGRLERPEAPKLRAMADQAVAQRRAAAQSRDTAGGVGPATGAPAGTPTSPGNTGGGPYGGAGGAAPTDPVGVAGATAVLNPDGTATAPAGAPDAVKQIIAAGNEIASKPYRYGGGHGKWKDSGYDCSGSVSYALHGAGLLDQPMASGGFERWAQPGKGTWVTVYAKADHMYMVVAGLRFDTSGADPSRWQTETRPTAGYAVRHPAGL